MITLRADYGGGPEHLYQLVNSLIGNSKIYIASPIDFPYWDRYGELVSIENLIAVPHRKFSFSVFKKLVKYIKQHKIDVIHSHGKGAGIYSRLLSLLTGIPCVHSFHGVHIGEYNKIQTNLYLLFERFLSSLTSRIIATSKSEYKQFSTLKICPEGKIALVINGVPIPDNKVSSPDYEAQIFKVLTISRFNHQKNTELLIPILLELRDKGYEKKFKFVIAGSGELIQDFKILVNRYALEEMVELLGFVDNPTHLYLDSFAYISTSRWEGMPMAPIYALAHGLPIIASNVEGNRDVVLHNKTGFLFDIDKPAQAAELLINTASSIALWEDLSTESIQYAQNSFSSSAMASNLAEVYYDVSTNKLEV
jgi:glycosyltransferase involved in cell wall biosynthesis